MYSVVFPHLSKMGFKRIIKSPVADIKTIQKWYPSLLDTYISFCLDANLDPYGGGNVDKQGNHPGLVISGFRDESIGGHDNSPHLFGVAFDIFVGELSRQVKIFPKALKYFNRVGVYATGKIIHVDSVNQAWIDKYSSPNSLYWFRDSGNQYTYFGDPEDLIRSVQ